MDLLTFTLEIIKLTIWPVVIFGFVILLKQPLSDLIQLIVKIKYKDFEIWFSKEMARIKAQIPTEALPPIKEERIDEEQILCRNSPTQAILQAWGKVEDTAYRKLKELYPPSSKYYNRLTSQSAHNDLMSCGALIPSAERLLQELYFLRNQIAHGPERSISTEDAIEYLSLTKRIRKQIESLSELPSMKLTPLTYMVLEINHLIDTGRYNDISLDDIRTEINNSTILQYLETKVGKDIDLSIILNGTTYPGFKRFYTKKLQSLCNAYSGNERRKWGVENLGLCLLLAWTNEIVQQGGGWHPSE